MKYNPDGQLYKVTTVFSHFTLLNILYLISCLPIFTIGAATSALYEVTIRYADDEGGELIAGYIRALRTNFVKATGSFLLLLLPMIALLYSSVFWFSAQTILASIFAVLLIAVAVYLFIVLVYCLALIGRYENSFKNTLKNAFLLPLTDPVRSLGLALIPITAFCLVVLFPIFKILLLIFGFSFVIYCSSFLLLSVFRKQHV
ncbi:YesL family protein [Enterococcus sp. DIV0876]|uniref:YesL family protein n=1 Tax=Enterococcus sp. DIV0876 TaxID=2774633 RepID=UPI003D2FEB93